MCRRVLILLTLALFVVTSLLTPFNASAMSEEQKKLFRENINYFDVDTCGDNSTGTDTESGGVSGDVQELAKQMLANDKITYWTNNGVNTRDVVVALSKGKKAYTTAPDGQPKTADLNPNILKFILEVAKTDRLMVNALTDKDHSSTSNHYKGLAVDLDVGNSAPLSVLTPAAQKYGGVKNNEGSHHHFDFLERPKDTGGGGTQPASGASGGAAPSAANASAGGSSAPAATGTCCPAGGASDFGEGTLPSNVPKPYNAIFTAAGNKFHVSPAFVAAVFYGGEHGNSFPDPPPPYGHGGPWATSYASANGPFQFLVSTWNAYSVDGNNDGKKDIQDLTDGAFGGAKYLAALGAKDTTSEGKLRQAAADYNGILAPGASYPSLVWAAFKKFSGGTAASGSSSGPTSEAPTDCAGGSAGDIGGYKNPYRDLKQKSPLRIDMGLDYAGKGPIYAIGKGKVNVTHKIGGGSGWPGPGGRAGGWVSYTLSEGPASGKIVYMAENCEPTVRPGDSVTADTKICDLDGLVSSWSEMGWAADKTTTWAAAHVEWSGHDSSAYYTAYGENFSQLIKKLGDKPGTKQAGAQKIGTLPKGWPTW